MKWFSIICQRFKKRRYIYLIWDCSKKRKIILDELKCFSTEELREARFRAECSLSSNKGQRSVSLLSFAISFSALVLTLFSLQFSFLMEFGYESEVIFQPVVYYIFGTTVFAVLAEALIGYYSLGQYRANKLKLDIINELLASYSHQMRRKVKVYKTHKRITA